MQRMNSSPEQRPDPGLRAEIDLSPGILRENAPGAKDASPASVHPSPTIRHGDTLRAESADAAAVHPSPGIRYGDASSAEPSAATVNLSPGIRRDNSASPATSSAPTPTVNLSPGIRRGDAFDATSAFGREAFPEARANGQGGLGRAIDGRGRPRGGARPSPGASAFTEARATSESRFLPETRPSPITRSAAAQPSRESTTAAPTGRTSAAQRSPRAAATRRDAQRPPVRNDAEAGRSRRWEARPGVRHPSRGDGEAVRRAARAVPVASEGRREPPPQTPPRSVARPSTGDAYRRYRQSAPRRSERRGSGSLLGQLLAVLLVVALGVGAGGWFAERHRRELLRETLRQYPLAYRELIQRYAAERELEPCYIAAIIRAESSFQADATSAVNAQGLMQILPETGEWLAGKFGETYAEGCLYDPETNIRYGCWYMGFLMERYHGDMACSSAAYHSGQGMVDRWLKDPAYSSDGRTLLVIPGENANTYVERVLNFYEKYKEIYGSGLTEHPEDSLA